MPFLSRAIMARKWRVSWIEVSRLGGIPRWRDFWGAHAFHEALQFERALCYDSCLGGNRMYGIVRDEIENLSIGERCTMAGA